MSNEDIIDRIHTYDQIVTELHGRIGSGNLTPGLQTDVDALFSRLNAERDQLLADLGGERLEPDPAPVTSEPEPSASEQSATEGTTFTHEDDNAGNVNVT